MRKNKNRKVYCGMCGWYHSSANICIAPAETYLSPDESHAHQPNIKNANNDCKDFKQLKTEIEICRRYHK